MNKTLIITKMKNVKTSIWAFSLMLLTVTAWAQSYDAARMKTDLEIAEDILSRLANQDGERSFWGSNVNGTYIEGYGVILSLPSNFSSRQSVHWGIGSSGSATYTIVGGKRISIDQSKLDSLQEATRNMITQVMKTFLVDYADLINQLKAEDKIMVVQKKSDFSYAVISGERAVISEERDGGFYSIDDAKRNMGVSAEIRKSDLIDYKQGKISRDQAMGKVVMNYDLDASSKKEPDLELFSSIIGRAFRSDLTETYWTSSSPSYERLEGFGVIYNMRVYSRNNLGNDYFSMPTLGEEKISREEGLKKVEEAYPKFEKAILNAMVEYGRTIRSLKEEENLMIKVQLTECKGCNMPESIDLAVKKSVLTQFDRGQLSLENAVKGVKITKYPYK